MKNFRKKELKKKKGKNMHKIVLFVVPRIFLSM